MFFISFAVHDIVYVCWLFFAMFSLLLMQLVHRCFCYFDIKTTLDPKYLLPYRISDGMSQHVQRYDISLSIKPKGRYKHRIYAI